jgi:hypothetical protein
MPPDRADTPASGSLLARALQASAGDGYRSHVDAGVSATRPAFVAQLPAAGANNPGRRPIVVHVGGRHSSDADKTGMPEVVRSTSDVTNRIDARPRRVGAVAGARGVYRR